jgi:thiol-disulfide isomerase/thioredoxin
VSALALLMTLTFTGCATTPGQPTPGGPPGQAGADPAALVLPDLAGQRRAVSELRGRVVWLDFWATWCAPCLESLPLYDRWQQELGAAGLQVVAVSVDEEDAKAAAFARAEAPHLLVLRDRDGRAAAGLDLPKMPTAFLIGRDGRLLYRHVGFDRGDAAALEQRIVEALQAQ